MDLHINPHTEQPIYRQIERQIAQAIAERRLQPGDSLQPETDLAAQLVVSPLAVHKAYLELESLGLCSGDLAGQFQVTDPGLGARPGGRSGLAMGWLGPDRLGVELESARQFQQRLLPPEEVCRSAFTVASRCYPASTLAGDFYDIIESSNGAVDLVIADTAGKGLTAGLIMAATKPLLPQVADRATPGEALTALNSLLRRILGAREFVAMIWARLEARKGILEIANAGLPDPSLLHPDGRIEWLEVAGQRLPVGARDGSQYSTLRQEMEPGGRLLLLTDGIPEAIDTHGQTFGYQRLQRLLEETLGRSSQRRYAAAGAWLDHLLDEASRRTSSLLTDDWTAMLVEFHPPTMEGSCSS